MNRPAALLTVLLIAALAFGLAQYREVQDLQSKVAELENAPPTYTITKVMDGDTFEIDHGLARIRLADVSVPETWEKGPDGEWRKIKNPDPRAVAAARYMESLIGREVTLEVVARDHYGRTLAHARLLPGNTPISEKITASGWAE